MWCLCWKGIRAQSWSPGSKPVSDICYLCDLGQVTGGLLPLGALSCNMGSVPLPSVLQWIPMELRYAKYLPPCQARNRHSHKAWHASWVKLLPHRRRSRIGPELVYLCVQRSAKGQAHGRCSVITAECILSSLPLPPLVTDRTTKVREGHCLVHSPSGS